MSSSSGNGLPSRPPFVIISLVYLQEAMKIKDTQIETLKQHLEFIQKKEETGSSTEYEVLSTKVRLSNAENQKVDIETARKTSNQYCAACSDYR